MLAYILKLLGFSSNPELDCYQTEGPITRLNGKETLKYLNQLANEEGNSDSEEPPFDHEAFWNR
jgi:hypothetical protein